MLPITDFSEDQLTTHTYCSLLTAYCKLAYFLSATLYTSSSSTKAGPSLQAEKPRLQFCRRQVFHRKRRNQGCSFTRNFSRCGSFSLLSAPHSSFDIWTDLKRSENNPGAQTRRWGEWIWLTGPSGLHQNSPQGLNISFIRVLYQIRDSEIQNIE